MPCCAGDMGQDQRAVVPEAVRLLQAVVDVVASSGWLSPALVAMEMSQMVVQVRAEALLGASWLVWLH